MTPLVRTDYAGSRPKVGRRGGVKTVILLGLLVLLAPSGFSSAVTAQESCRIERVTYRVQGLQLVSWIMKPIGEGRFPALAWSHGAKFATAAAPIITERTPCLPLVTGKGWMIFFPQTRGYGGSEGPPPQTAFNQGPVPFLETRADDTNASVEWLKTRPDVNPDCIANMGFSQGAVTALLASGRKPGLYRATIADAPVSIWPRDDNRFVGMTETLRAGRNVSTPILVQANTTDQDSFIEVTRVLVREFRRWGRSVEYKEYTHPVGHQFFNLAGRPEFLQTWGGDVVSFVERAFAGCSR
jgi:dipeptidyl aminopeptidase/acylaminoacyl peptidase